MKKSKSSKKIQFSKIVGVYVNTFPQEATALVLALFVEQDFYKTSLRLAKKHKDKKETKVLKAEKKVVDAYRKELWQHLQANPQFKREIEKSTEIISDNLEDFIEEKLLPL